MIELKITGETPLEALATLTAFGCRCIVNPDVNAAANRIMEREKTELGSDPTPEPAPVAATSGRNAVPGPNVPGNGQPAVPVPPVSDSDGSSAIPSAAEVRKQGIEASRKYGKEAVVTILKQFGVTGISAIAEKDRTAFLDKLAALDVGDRVGGEDA